MKRKLLGTENMIEFPEYPKGSGLGISVYGTTVEHGEKCYKIGKHQEDRIRHLGYQTMRRGRAYSYVWMPENKD